MDEPKMKKEDIIRMAQEAGCVEDKHYKGEVIFISNDALERFFHMAQAAEREACAKLCEDNADDDSEGDWDSACINCANIIRSRSSQ